METTSTLTAPVQAKHVRPVQKLELRCASCSYGVVVEHAPPACPMCRAEAWEPAPWRPFSNRDI